MQIPSVLPLRFIATTTRIIARTLHILFLGVTRNVLQAQVHLETLECMQSI